mgnify:CR=1 FL=1|jgi:putative hydrolase
MLKVDLHNHTIKSSCGLCTVNEMINEAKERGLEVFGLADHGPKCGLEDVHFQLYYRLPKYFGKTRVLFGGEFNILDEKGNLDAKEKILKKLDYAIAGFHSIGQEKNDIEYNTKAMINAIKNPYVKIISHPTYFGYFEVDIERVAEAACEHKVLLEINISHFRCEPKLKQGSIPAIKKMIEIIKKNNHFVIVNSDSHHTSEIGDDSCLDKFRDEIGLTDDIIINNNMEELKKYFPIDVVKEN